MFIAVGDSIGRSTAPVTHQLTIPCVSCRTVINRRL